MIISLLLPPPSRKYPPDALGRVSRPANYVPAAVSCAGLLPGKACGVSCVSDLHVPVIPVGRPIVRHKRVCLF